MQSIHGLPIATSLEEACDPHRLALLIYDMQVGICQQVGAHIIDHAQHIRTQNRLLVRIRWRHQDDPCFFQRELLTHRADVVVDLRSGSRYKSASV